MIHNENWLGLRDNQEGHWYRWIMIASRSLGTGARAPTVTAWKMPVRGSEIRFLARKKSINQWMYSYHLVSIYLEVKNSQPKPGTTPGTKPTKSGLGSTQSWRWLKQQYWDGFTATYKMHQHAIYIYTYTNKYIVRGRVQKEIYRRLSDMVTLGSRLTISNHTQEW